MANLTEQQAALAWDQRVAAYEAVDKAEQSVRKAEGDFATGAVKGALGSVAVGTAMLGGMIAPGVSGEELANDTRNLIEDKFVKPEESIGFDAGMIGGDVAQMASPMMAGKASIAAIKNVDELTALEIQQAQDLLYDLKRGGGENRLIRESLSKIEEFLAEKGVDLKKLFPSKPGERNQSAMPVKPKDPLYDSEGRLLKGDKAATNKHSQTQHNPMATAGLKPQGFAAAGDTWENAGIYAVRVNKHWQKGFDPVQFIEHTLSARKTAAREAAKGAKDGPPQFWVYDQQANRVLVVKRNKSGDLVVGEPTGSGSKAINPFKTDEVAEDGSPLLRDEIDFVVDSNGMERLRMQLYKTSMEMLDSK